MTRNNVRCALAKPFPFGRRLVDACRLWRIYAGLHLARSVSLYCGSSLSGIFSPTTFVWIPLIFAYLWWFNSYSLFFYRYLCSSNVRQFTMSSPCGLLSVLGTRLSCPAVTSSRIRILLRRSIRCRPWLVNSIFFCPRRYCHRISRTPRSYPIYWVKNPFSWGYCIVPVPVSSTRVHRFSIV